MPLIVLLGAGFGVRRAGRAGLALAGAFCLCSLVFTLEIDRLPRLQREDLRNAAAQVGPLRPDKAVVTIRYAVNQPLHYYLDAEFATGPLPPLREIDLVGSRQAAEDNARRLLPPAFHRGRVQARLLQLHPDPLPLPPPRAGSACGPSNRVRSSVAGGAPPC